MNVTIPQDVDRIKDRMLRKALPYTILRPMIQSWPIVIVPALRPGYCVEEGWISAGVQIDDKHENESLCRLFMEYRIHESVGHPADSTSLVKIGEWAELFLLPSEMLETDPLFHEFAGGSFSDCVSALSDKYHCPERMVASAAQRRGYSNVVSIPSIAPAFAR